jgi:hypothetical protein
MGIRNEDFRTFPSIAEAISWCLDQRPYGYSRGWIDDIEIDMATGRIVHPERVDERTLRAFDAAWREMKQEVERKWAVG